MARTTDRTDGFADLSEVPALMRDLMRRDVLVKRVAFQAREGKQYAPDTSSAAFTVRLPRMPHDGAVVAIRDITGGFSTNVLTVDAVSNTIKVGGATAAQTCTLASPYSLTFFVWDRTNRRWVAMTLATPIVGAPIVKTSGFTADPNGYYLCVFAASGTITLPAAPTDGDRVLLSLGGAAIVYTVDPGLLKLNGLVGLYYPDANQTLLLTYNGATNGWV